jgi:ABC-type transport system substrate-binding protein
MWTRGSPDAVKILGANPSIKTDVVVRVASVRVLGLNPNYAPLRDIRVRQALAHALNKKDISVATGGQLAPAEQPLARLPWLLEAQAAGAFPIYPYDPDRARRLLEQAGYPHLRIVFTHAIESPTNTIAQVVAEQWRRVGVDVVLEPLEHGTWQDRTHKGQYQVTHLGIGRGPDPDELARDLFHTSNFPPGNNLGFYEKADGLIDAGARERNATLRRRIYVALVKQAMTDLPFLPLAYDAYVAAYRAPIKSMVHGINNDFAADTIVLVAR